jgi:hypothetical protein
MASGKGQTLADDILDHVLGGPSYTRLTTVYVALYTAAPTWTGGGTEVSTSGTGYTRQAISNDLGTPYTQNWTVTTAGVKSNQNLIDFGTATGNWGTVVAGAIMSASTGGYILYFGTLTVAKTINTGDGFRIPNAGLVLTES